MFAVIKQQSFQAIQPQLSLNQAQIAAKVSEQIGLIHAQLMHSQQPTCEDFATYTKSQFDTFFNDILDVTLKQNFERSEEHRLNSSHLDLSRMPSSA